MRGLDRASRLGWRCRVPWSGMAGTGPAMTKENCQSVLRRSGRQVLPEKLKRQFERTVGLGLAVGLATDPREGMVGTGIFVDGDERIGRQPALQQIVHLGLDPAVAQRHV